MIIFDLDGTLADCEHRRHFVDPAKNSNYVAFFLPSDCIGEKSKSGYMHKENREEFKPDWESFYKSCEKDEPIFAVFELHRSLCMQNYYYKNLDIWSGRCESVREKTENWLRKHGIHYSELKMRPIGDSTPVDQLKEKWLDEAIQRGNTIDFVFDDRPKVVRMWRRRGIFVFNCYQHHWEF